MNVPMPPPLPGSEPSPGPVPPRPYGTPQRAAPAPAVPTSTTAVVSLVSGLLAWLVLPIIGMLVAIIAGHIARGEIRRANGTLDGDWMAIAGLALGYLQLAFTLLFVLAIFVIFGGIAALATAAG